jgi:hypothetical protein
VSSIKEAIPFVPGPKEDCRYCAGTGTAGAMECCNWREEKGECCNNYIEVNFSCNCSDLRRIEYDFMIKDTEKELEEIILGNEDDR